MKLYTYYTASFFITNLPKFLNYCQSWLEGDVRRIFSCCNTFDRLGVTRKGLLNKCTISLAFLK